MKGNLVLSLFPGIGMLDIAFEQEGFVTVCGPDVIWGGDIRRFHPPSRKFDGVIGGPPCQSFSSLAHLVRANGYEPKFGNLIPEFERCILEAQPTWFLMENVPAAPEPVVTGYGVKSFLLDNSALDGGDGWGLEQRRVRRLSFGMRGVVEPPCLLRWIDLAVFLLPDADPRDHNPPDGQRRDSISGSGGVNWNQNETEYRKTRCGSVTSAPVDNSQEAKGRVRNECINGSHGKPPSARDRVRRSPVTAGHEQPDGLTERKRRKAVSSSNGGNGRERNAPGAGNGGKGRYRLADALRLQGLPDDFLEHSPFTAEGKLKAVANGVPIPMGRAIARAIKEALTYV